MAFLQSIDSRGLVLGAAALLAGALAPQAQAAWPHGFPNAEVVRTVAAPNGDILIAGNFTGETVMGSFTLNAAGLQDIFVARLDAGGRVLWAKSAGGILTDTAVGLALDASNNAYLVGNLYGNASFGVGVTTSGPNTRQDGFVARISAQGTWDWVRRANHGGSYPSSVNDVVVLPGNSSVVPPIPDSLILTGAYRQNVTFNAPGSGNSVTLTGGSQAQDDFLARMQADGSAWLWAVNRPGAGVSEIGRRLLLDQEGGLYMLGEEAQGQTTLRSETFGPGTNLADNWEVAEAWGGAAHIVSQQHFDILTAYFGGSPGLALRSGHVAVQSKAALDTTEASAVTVEAVIIRGNTILRYPAPPLSSGGYNYSSYLSEHPDWSGTEDLVLEYLSATGDWRELQRFTAGGAAGERISASITNGDPAIRHSNLKLRVRMIGGSGGEFDWWFVERLTAKAYFNEGYIHSISNVGSSSPVFGTLRRFHGSIAISDALAFSSNGQTRIAVVGKAPAGVSIPLTSCPAVPGSTAGFVAVLRPGSGTYLCDHLKATGSGDAYAVASDGTRVFVAGAFSGSLGLGPHLISGNAGGADAYIAGLDLDDGQWAWLTGGAPAVGNPPAAAGGTGVDSARSMIATAGGQLYVSGRFQGIAQFGPVDQLVAQGATDGFIVKLSNDGRFFQPEAWTVGVPLTPPSGAKVDTVAMLPEVFLDGVQVQATGNEYRWFTWVYRPATSSVAATWQFIPLQPTPQVEVRWRVNTDPTSPARVVTQGAGVWPARACGDIDLPGMPGEEGCYQAHVIGAPVEAKPAGYQILGDLVLPSGGSSGATLDGGVFNAPRSGYAVIQYVQGTSTDQMQFPTFIEVVRSLPYHLTVNFQDNVSVEIGKKITSTAHNEPSRSGWVLNELAYYDGSGVNAAYNRAARTGVIIPVNRYSSRRIQDAGRELAVAWYRSNGKGVYWPSRAVRYQPRWPYDPDRIVIASEQGSEVFGQQILGAASFPQAHIYVQNDYAAPGFNPNDEHAMMAPSSTGTGADAVFALRSDFGGDLDPAAPSDPYVLLKYYNGTTLEWNFKLYRVLATGAGYNRFRYTGTAGTTVSPPYPVRLLPGCAETFVQGQAVDGPPPPPFFQDHKNQLWAKSAGSGKVHYFYPMQPGFYQDNDNNDVNDYQPGQCTPWLARLPQSQGGAATPMDPIPVEYTIAWPENPPLLVAGETLLAPKRGLPDISSQAAVEIVYDQTRDTAGDDPEPSQTLAQLIDPLSTRWVRLSQIPASVATSFRTDGFQDITGSSDGTQRMPASLGERMYWDGMNKRLVMHGVFDETGAGDPKLLLNVMTQRERMLLKKFNGGDGTEEETFTGNCRDSGACTWDQAVEALFRLTRNPSGIKKICRDSSLDENRVRQCHDMVTDIPAGELLIAYEDPENTGFLQPLSALGGGSALTAGAAQGAGYMTIAFNNDPSLGALPVSLEVIRVGCLESSSLPGPMPYQGQINVIAPDDIFDEQLVLRHGGDFGGNPDALQFEWYFHPDANGTPPMPVPSPETGQMHGWIQFPVANPNGAMEISIEGANIQTLSDNWYLARYRGLSACGNDQPGQWSLWAGQPGATPTGPRAQLAEGWVKRVLGRLNPFEARVQDFGSSETNNYASMLIQLGERYSGPIALNSDPDNLNSIGLIEAYTTVMRRALQLSADSTPPIDYGPANAAVLLVASRLADFYTLLGNEAYADAQDPTIAIDSNGGTYSLSPTIFNFQNQLTSLLDEELVLLRGRDDSHGPVAASPVYNRLFWNFTTGDGEVAYALSYNIADQDVNGVLDEYDARIMFPQGHGDAWGHYLTAMTTYYNLLRHPYFSWNPQSEAVQVAGVPINVDFLDERQFVETAVAKAKTGAEIVDLTYRKAYVENPNGQYQGYDDTNAQRAWGLSEWGRRAGTGAYFDWVTGNAILPVEDPNPAHVGIQRIERGNISELAQITSEFASIQGKVDRADAGLNPLGLAKGVVSFDIDPAQLERFNKTQFEQVWERAMGSLNNALKVWDYANLLSNQLRRTQDSADDLWDMSIDEETDFTNQMIEIFGYPYADDIGPGGTYPDGYDGPDLYHYMYMDAPALAGTTFDFDTPVQADMAVRRVKRFKGYYRPAANGVGFFNTSRTGTLGGVSSGDCDVSPMGTGCALGDTDNTRLLEVEYVTTDTPGTGLLFTKPDDWTGTRRAPGRLQQTLQEILMAQISLKQGILEYDAMRLELEAGISTLRATFGTAQANINLAIAQRNELRNLTIAAQVMTNSAIATRRVGNILSEVLDTTGDCVPDNVIAGLAGGGDLFSTIKCAIDGSASTITSVADGIADGLEIAGNAIDASKEDVSELSGIRTLINDSNLDLYNLAGEIDAIMRQEPLLRSEIFARAEAIKQLRGEYLATLAEGLRVYEQLIKFRRGAAAATQEARYRDMAFRIFRNDALQKYRAAFDLAARYVYLAASAYDYETNLLGGDSKAGQAFLTSVVKQRSLGQVLNGVPVAGSPGLADTMAQLKLNFDVLKGQMGFNAPQVETNRFSLRRELFRIDAGADGDEGWRSTLEAARVADLWQIPEFRRYARPFAPESVGPQPGLVFEFSTNVTSGLNFFGWDLGANDSSYNPSRFATRIRSVGAWFGNYASLPLADDPNVYLIPVGQDVLRSPDPLDFTVRQWQVVEQKIPVPFPIGAAELGRYDWVPTESLDGARTDLIRYPMMRAFHYSEPFDDNQVSADSRLIGRSVWNRRWLLIIPGSTFLADPNDGLDTFIHGAKVPGGNGVRDGHGVDDIRIFFKTYSYSGN
ncbi:MAG TPA: hypothetical protein PKE36_05665 [Chiayiivirga sp.]|nr:hypothetical protein [Chiayiivirga sp.]